VLALASQPHNVRLPAVDHVAEAVGARELLHVAEELLLLGEVAGGDDLLEPLEERARSPYVAVERPLLELEAEQLVEWPDAAVEREERVEEARDRLRGIEMCLDLVPEPVALRGAMVGVE
jgi:hypothetical protein